jgi:two-component system, cell cycle sensor histidine kinase and response regulator CckA
MPRGEHNVLLVDDDDLVRPVIADSLREAGYEVVEAADAEEAISLVHALPQIDLVISDVVMPGMDGPTMVAKLRRERPDLRVLFITGHSGQHSLTGERVLRKPFTNGELTRAVVASMSISKKR